MARKLCLALLIAVVFFASSVLAVELFGIKVYPGASYDATSSNKLKDAMRVEASCFRTNDSVTEVVAFYKTQQGLKAIGDADEEGAMFRKRYVDVTIQKKSWMDMATGKMMVSTLICIVQQKE
jgi:hypothetical protein